MPALACIGNLRFPVLTPRLLTYSISCFRFVVVNHDNPHTASSKPIALVMAPSRREFLATIAAAAAALGATQKTSAAKAALQLYSVRGAMEKDISGTLARIADMGYSWVETAFFPAGVTYTQAGQLLRDAGLHVAASHIELPIGDQRDALLEAAEAFNCDRMVWHGWPEDERYQSLDGIKRLADVYNEAHHFCESNGLRLGLHNHWWEFQTIPESVAGQIEWQERFAEDLPPGWGGLPFFLPSTATGPGHFLRVGHVLDALCRTGPCCHSSRVRGASTTASY